MGTIDETPLKHAEAAVANANSRLGHVREYLSAVSSYLDGIEGDLETISKAISKAHIAPSNEHAAEVLNAIKHVLKQVPDDPEPVAVAEDTEPVMVWPEGWEKKMTCSQSGGSFFYTNGWGWLDDIGRPFYTAKDLYAALSGKASKGTYKPSYPQPVIDFVTAYRAKHGGAAPKHNRSKTAVAKMEPDIGWSNQFSTDFPDVPHPLTGVKGKTEIPEIVWATPWAEKRTCTYSGANFEFTAGYGWIDDELNPYLDAQSITNYHDEAYYPSYPPPVIQYVRDYRAKHGEVPPATAYSETRSGAMELTACWGSMFSIDFPDVPHPISGGILLVEASA